MRLLDCFCGLGGVSDGFAEEGFEVLGIDIEDMPAKGYKHKFLRASILDLKGEDFRGYDVIWGSPPCRDFCLFSKRFGKTWKANPPNPERGLNLVTRFQHLVIKAQPKIWIMENVPELQKYIGPAEVVTALGNPSKSEMRRAFWGNFPSFLIPKSKRKPMRFRKEVLRNQKEGAYRTREERAKIPIVVSRAFAKACKQELIVVQKDKEKTT